MNNLEEELIGNLGKFIKDKKDMSADILYLYSLINQNMSKIDEIQKSTNEDDVLEIKANQLQDFFDNFKISNEILAQMINNYMDKSSIEKMKIENDIDYSFENIKVEKIPPIRWLISYSNYLINHPFLVDDNLESFLSFLETGQIDNASLKMDELNVEQIKTIPKHLSIWVSENSTI